MKIVEAENQNIFSQLFPACQSSAKETLHYALFKESIQKDKILEKTKNLPSHYLVTPNIFFCLFFFARRLRRLVFFFFTFFTESEKWSVKYSKKLDPLPPGGSEIFFRPPVFFRPVPNPIPAPGVKIVL